MATFRTLYPYGILHAGGSESFLRSHVSPERGRIGVVCASQSSVLRVSASKSSEWNHESHEIHETGRPRPGIRQPHGTGATPHSPRRSPPRHPAPFVYFVYFVVVFLRVWWAKPLPTNGTHTHWRACPPSGEGQLRLTQDRAKYRKLTADRCPLPTPSAVSARFGSFGGSGGARGETPIDRSRNMNTIGTTGRIGKIAT